MPLAAEVSATDTTISVDDVSQFPESGTVQIDDELMSYYGIGQGTGASAFNAEVSPQPGELLDVQRGLYGTTRSAHPQGTVVIVLISTATPCVGDCDESQAVTVDKLLKMVNIALGIAPVRDCLAGDGSRDGEITIDEILKAVNNALSGCPKQPSAVSAQLSAGSYVGSRTVRALTRGGARRMVRS